MNINPTFEGGINSVKDNSKLSGTGLVAWAWMLNDLLMTGLMVVDGEGCRSGVVQQPSKCEVLSK